MVQNPCTNTVKVQLQKAETVTKAIEICRAARVAGWSVMMGASENGLECNEPFLADFAGLLTLLVILVIDFGDVVAVGAGQLNCGGLYTTVSPGSVLTLLR
jgi:hypothetical protein